MTVNMDAAVIAKTNAERKRLTALVGRLTDGDLGRPLEGDSTASWTRRR